MFRRKPSPDSSPAAEVLEPTPTGSGKGRPTPKRRTNSAPVTPAPRTRKEAVAWQKQHATAKVAGQRKLTPAEYKQAMRDGDPAVLPRRDQGPVRQLARDYVDSRRMAANYLLLLFPLLLIGNVIPILQILVLVLLAVLVVELAYTGRAIRRLATEGGLQVGRETTFGLGMYAISRAYFPRKWRRPAPRLKIGEKL